MRRLTPFMAVILFTGLARPDRPADEGALIHSMDDLRVTEPKEKGHSEVVEGKFGKAVKFRFEEGCQGTFFGTPIRGTPEWDKAAGFSFWVKGDGSHHFGGLQFIWNDDYAMRYDYMFPIDSTEWRKIVVPWRDLLPALSKPGSKFLGGEAGNAPSKLSTLMIGKWWYWRDYGAHSFALDEMRLEPSLTLDRSLYLPAGAPLERTLAKLKAGKPVTVVVMGDSLADPRHWANRETRWPDLLAARLKEKYHAEVKVVNTALGGTELRQNLVLMPRWLADAPEPDLVTVCFGGNDWEGGMRGAMFHETCLETVDRIRHSTHGKADVLLMTTVPSVEMWTTRDELGQAVRAAAQERKAGLADTEKAFHAAGETNRERLYCSDKVHMGGPGHELLAKTVQGAIEGSSR